LKDCSLFVITQVDKFIFTGTDQAMDGFAAYASTRFELSELEFYNFSVYRTVFNRDKAGIHIRQREKITELVECPLARDRRRMHDAPVTRAAPVLHVNGWIDVIYRPSHVPHCCTNGRCSCQRAALPFR
jgi:hypothetical protein